MERDDLAEAIAFLEEAQVALDEAAASLKERIAAFLQDVSLKTAEKAEDFGEPQS